LLAQGREQRLRGEVGLQELALPGEQVAAQAGFLIVA